MMRTLNGFLDELIADEQPLERMEPEGLAAEFAAFFGL